MTREFSPAGRMRVDVDSQDDNDSSGSVKDLAHESKKKINHSDVCRLFLVRL
jgi:hypothetical protein